MNQCVSSKIGGYDVVLSEEFSDDLFTCPVCKKLLRDPIQTKLGELVCLTCHAEKNKSENTDNNNEVTSPNDFFVDKFRKRQIQGLSCICPYKKFGCRWNGTVALAESHQAECRFQPAKCPLCCAELESPAVMDEHFQNCSQMIGNTSCPFERFGCRFKVKNPEEMKAHVIGEELVHSLLQEKHCESLKTELTEMKNKVSDWNKKAKVKTEKLKLECNVLGETLSSIENTVKEITINQEKLTNSLLPRSNDKKDFPSDDANLARELSVKISDMEKRISDLHLKQQIYENISYNGTLLWKVDQFQFRMNQAVIGRVPAVHSAPCFAENGGYRFCARLYLNGDGMGKRTHVSIFFVLMQGAYDNLLTWPFRKRVTFTLINQEDDSKHVQESFLPDPQSPSFQKPTGSMNVAAGCPMFITKDQLQLSDGFVKDDAIFFRIGVT